MKALSVNSVIKPDLIIFYGQRSYAIICSMLTHTIYNLDLSIQIVISIVFYSRSLYSLQPRPKIAYALSFLFKFKFTELNLQDSAFLWVLKLLDSLEHEFLTSN